MCPVESLLSSQIHGNVDSSCVPRAPFSPLPVYECPFINPQESMKVVLQCVSNSEQKEKNLLITRTVCSASHHVPKISPPSTTSALVELRTWQHEVGARFLLLLHCSPRSRCTCLLPPQQVQANIACVLGSPRRLACGII